LGLQVTIIGLGLVGGSLGLALKKAGIGLQVVGHDKNHDAARSAHKKGCVDRTDWNLISACDGADVVIISTPLPEIKSTLAALAAELKPGCVVTDTASLKVPVLNWARESLPAGVHFVGGHPIIKNWDGSGSVPADGPAADLLAEAVYCVTPAPSTSPDAVQQVCDLAEAVGARPYYMEAAEHDGVVAAVEQLPLLMALALRDAVSDSPSHREIAQLVGGDFRSMTSPLAADVQGLDRDWPGAMAEMCASNAANVARWLDAFLSRLSGLRSSLAQPDRESLKRAFAIAQEARAWWLEREIEGEATDYRSFGVTRKLLGDTFRPSPGRGREGQEGE